LRYRLSAGRRGAAWFTSSRSTASRRRSKAQAAQPAGEPAFKLDPGTADQLIASATLVEGEAVDLYHFTRHHALGG